MSKKKFTDLSYLSFNEVGDGRKVVGIAGTRGALVAVLTPAKIVIITAMPANTNVVVVGGATVVAAVATRQGIPLYAGESVTLLVGDLTDVYVDAITSEEGVLFLYMS